MKANIQLAVVCALLTGCAQTSEWIDKLGRATTGSGYGLTQDEIVAGLRAALDKGVDHAVSNLGREGGFLQNIEVRIPIPENLQPVERTMRAIGRGRSWMSSKRPSTARRRRPCPKPQASWLVPSNK